MSDEVALQKLYRGHDEALIGRILDGLDCSHCPLWDVCEKLGSDRRLCAELKEVLR